MEYNSARLCCTRATSDLTGACLCDVPITDPGAPNAANAEAGTRDGPDPNRPSLGLMSSGIVNVGMPSIVPWDTVDGSMGRLVGETTRAGRSVPLVLTRLDGPEWAMLDIVPGAVAGRERFLR